MQEKLNIFISAFRTSVASNGL